MSDPTAAPPRISVVVPIHNEADYLPRGLPELVAEVTRAGFPAEILLVENGSTDDTVAVAEAAAADDGRVRVLRLPDPDYGAAMRHGFLSARAPWVVNFDIDYFSSDFLRRAMAEEGDADVVLGSKLAPGSIDTRTWFRRLATRVFNLLLKVILRSGVSDTHGMKAVRSEVVAALAPGVASTKDLFDTELVIRAERAGYRIVEVPVVVEERRETAQGLLKRVPRTLRGMWRIRRLLAAERRGR